MSETDQQDQPRRYATMADLAARWGVTRGALHQRIQAGRFLAPDIVLGRSYGWDPARADEWWQQANHTRGQYRRGGSGGQG